jgi:hypothetical protein
MKNALTEASILDHYIAQRTAVNVWLHSGVRLTGIPRFQDQSVLTLEPLDTAPPEGYLIVYKRACASVGKVSSRDWARLGAAKRKSRPISDETNEEIKQ